MYNIEKIYAYLTYFLKEEISRHVKEKYELERTKSKIKDDTECLKTDLDDYRNKIVRQQQIINVKRETPGVSAAATARLEEMYASLETQVCEIDEKINELYDGLDEKTAKIDEQIYEIDEKIDYINELLEDGEERAGSEECEQQINTSSGESSDEEFLREIEEEINNIEMQIPKILYKNPD